MERSTITGCLYMIHIYKVLQFYGVDNKYKRSVQTTAHMPRKNSLDQNTKRTDSA